jgi:hypothetical protein
VHVRDPLVRINLSCTIQTFIASCHHHNHHHGWPLPLPQAIVTQHELACTSGRGQPPCQRRWPASHITQLTNTNCLALQAMDSHNYHVSDDQPVNTAVYTQLTNTNCLPLQVMGSHNYHVSDDQPVTTSKELHRQPTQTCTCLHSLAALLWFSSASV